MGIDRLQPIRLINCFLKPTTYHATREFGWVLTDTTKNCRTHLPESLLLAKAPQKQTQTKNCRTHLPKSLLQRPLRNKRKRRIATPTSPRACRKGPAQTDSNEELPHLPFREPVAKALQQQTQKKNCRTHLPESLSQKPLSNKYKRRIAAPTSPRACCRERERRIARPTSPRPCRKGPAETNANEELCARLRERGSVQLWCGAQTIPTPGAQLGCPIEGWCLIWVPNLRA